MGAVGSHHVLATAVYGRREGFNVGAVLIPQPRTEHAATNLRAELSQGLVAWPSAQALAPLALARRMGKGAYFVQVGGSSVLGAMGYVDAARELSAQVRAGQMPAPDLVVVTLGSGGTAAGLAAGFALEQMRTRVLAVSVVDPPQVFAVYTHWLAKKCVALAGGQVQRGEIAARLSTTARYLGKGYGYATAEGTLATERAASAGLVLDATYTAKAFAATLDRVGEGNERVILYWHTLSSAPMAQLLEGAPVVPPRLERLLR
jgi:1-aminocyclopropane-1-carboxylate deaminase/D-cysteine desulfhydrase-like pyridoxal-dependent ACC family enzyme